MPILKKITQEELDEVIENHELWLKDEEGGERANLSRHDLSGMDLSYKDLSYVDLSFANLSCANLYEASLNYANLTDANLKNAKLSQSNTNKVKGIGIYSIDNIGSFKGKVTYIPSLDQCYAGCWRGNLEEFLVKGLEMNESDKDKRLIKLAYEFLKETKENKNDSE